MFKRAPKLGTLLIEKGLISPEDLEHALESQKGTQRRLGETLVELGVLASNTLVNVIAEQMGFTGCSLRHGLIDPKAVGVLDIEEARRLRVLPLFLVKGRLTVAMAEPQSLPTVDRIAQLTQCEINPVFALESNILEYLEKYSKAEVSVESFLTSLSESDVEVVERTDAAEGVNCEIDQMVDGSPVINLVNLAILTAVQRGASDIHVEPDEKGTRIRYRVDGVLQQLMKPPAGMHAAIVSRIKVIGKMDISEKRLPQEGRVHVVAEGRDIDLRVSTMPTILGEKVVIRILDRARINVTLESLGFEGAQLQSLQSMLRRPHGLILVTGPTGSGKTTTLYCALDQLKEYGRNVITVEDPVEYQLDLVNQIQINDGIGLSFPRALRSILRQDPDVILVGEIRDAETARVAVQAALTGHMVLSTLHTNTSVGAITRLLDMGIEPYLLASALNGVVAQRLARLNCRNCRVSYYPPETALADAGRAGETRQAYRKSEGCAKCNYSGFAGRLAVVEMMVVDDDIRQHIHNESGEEEVRKLLRKNNWIDLRGNGIQIADRGLAPLEEVLRVTHIETDTRVKAERNDTTESQGGFVSSEKTGPIPTSAAVSSEVAL